MKLFAIILLLHGSLVCRSQSSSLQRQISVDVTDIRLEDLLEYLKRDFDLKIHYGVDNIADDGKLTLKASRIRVQALLDIISSKFSVSFVFIGDYIIVKRVEKKPVELPTTSEHERIVETTVPKDSLPEPPTPVDKVVIIEQLYEEEKEDSVIQLDVDLTESYVIKKDEVSQVRNDSAVVSRKNDVSYQLAVFTAMDIHQFHFNGLPDKSQTYSSPFTYGYGISLYKNLCNKISVGLGVLYNVKEYSYHRNFKILQPDDPVSIPDATKLKQAYVESTVEGVFEYLHLKSFSLDVLSGFNFSVLTNKKETTSYLTYGEPSTQHFIHQANSYLWGPFVAVKLKWAAYKSIHLFLEPRYVHYIKPINEGIMNTGTDLLRLKAGIHSTL